jgi:glycosyltransferase involved in cell wall biosynthesis
LAARRIATPYVVTFHSGGHSSRLRQSLRRFQHHTLRPLLAEARRLIAVSRFEAQFFATRLRFPEQKFVVIPNGCHTPLADTSFRDPTRPLLLSVGRLERYKGHHRVLDAFPHVLRAHPGARLRIVGTGPFESFLRQRAEQLGVTSAVEIGAVDPRRRDIMTQLFAEASLVLLLSDYEAHPIAVMEAIALGCPALVTATSGLAELADRGLAQAVPAASDTTTVAQAILANLANPPAPITTALPSWDHCADELAAVYERVVEEHRCAS